MSGSSFILITILQTLILVGAIVYLEKKIRRASKKTKSDSGSGKAVEKIEKEIQKLRDDFKSTRKGVSEQIDSFQTYNSDFLFENVVKPVSEVRSQASNFAESAIHSEPSISKINGQWVHHDGARPALHPVKQANIRAVAKAYGIRTLVETGTFKGHMVAAQLDHFDKIYSIELNEEFYQGCLKRFEGVDKVELLQGDSGQRLPEIVAKLEAPALFWLDGHYSGADTAGGDTEPPIFAELSHIFDSPGFEQQHAILIDDAREFRAGTDYPETAAVEAFVAKNAPEMIFDVIDDSLRILPKS